MRILYAALKYDYGIPERGFSFEHYNFYDSLVAMGHEVEYFDYYPLYRAHGSLRMTQMLADRVEAWKPDMLFTFLFSDQFDARVLRQITDRRKTITFNWFADDHWRFENFTARWAPCFTFVSTTDAESLPRYKAIGCKNVLLTQWAANPRIYTPGDGTLTHDVTFVGQGYGDRPRLIASLRKRGIPVRVWGTLWHVRRWHIYARKLGLLGAASLEKLTNETRISQEDMIRVFQTSRINLNLSNASQAAANQIKGRNFELPACGGFQLSGYAHRMEEFLIPGKEIVCYDSTDELAEKIAYYLGHEEERKAIARAGYERTMRDHLYEHRFTALFRAMGVVS
jgi:spore maturation protein CgeB